jgi:hypothetical protein
MTAASAFIYLSIAIAALGIVAIAGFSVRSLAMGKVEPIKLGLMSVPLVVFGILAVAMPTISMAAIYTVLVMLVLGLVGLLLSGVRGLFM